MNYTISKINIPFKKELLYKEKKILSRSYYKFSRNHQHGFYSPFEDLSSEASKLFPFEEISYKEKFSVQQNTQKVKIAKLIGLESPLTFYSDEDCFKFKIGLNLPLEREKISSLIRINPFVKIRLDANFSLSTKELCDFALSIPPDNLEFIEDVSDKEDKIISFAQLFPHKIACDETLEFVLENNLQDLFKYFIVKPSQKLSLSGLFSLKNQLHSSQKIILSSTYDHPETVALYKQIIVREEMLDTHHGLDTNKYLNLDESHETFETSDFPFFL